MKKTITIQVKPTYTIDLNALLRLFTKHGVFKVTVEAVKKNKTNGAKC